VPAFAGLAISTGVDITGFTLSGVLIFIYNLKRMDVLASFSEPR